MIPRNDYTEQKLEYNLHGELGGGRWKLQVYIPTPSLIMVNIKTGEKMSFGVDSLTANRFEPVKS